MNKPPETRGWLEQEPSEALRAKLAPYMFRILAGFGAIAFLVGLWFGLSFLLATDRGLDLTDEGLYLLAADPPHRDAVYGFPFGWHTGPLFRLVGYDIATFRTLGAVLLVLAGAWCGWSAISSSLSGALPKTRTCAILWPLAGLVAGVLATLLYYGSLLSTPSYNWVNLFGILIAAGGYFQLICDASLKSLLKSWLISCVIAFGLFVTIPAKPSSAPLLLGLGGLLIFFSSSICQSLKAGLAILACLVIWLSVAILFGVWQWPLVPFFTASFQGPKFMPEHTLTGSLLEIAAIPWHFLTSLMGQGTLPLIGLACGFGLAAIAGAWGSSSNWKAALFMFLSLLVATCGCLAVAAAIPFPLANNSPVFRFAHGETTTAALSFTLGLCLSLVPEIRKTAGLFDSENAGRRMKKVISIAVFICAIPFVFAFGSGNGPYPLAAMASGFFPLAAIVVTTLVASTVARAASVGAALIFSSLLVIAIMKDSYALPYRNQPIVTQTETIYIGKHNSPLRVDKTTAVLLLNLKEQAEAAGWKPETPLFGVVWDWASTVPYFLGAKVPNCLMLTLFQYPTSVEIARYRISRSLGNFDSPNAWILTSNPKTLKPEQAREVNDALGALYSVSRLKFPRDYQRVAISGNLELWKPAVF